MKIFVFIWNTQSVRLSETPDPQLVVDHRETRFTGYVFSAAVPDFFEPLMHDIKTAGADIVVMGFQEDASPGSYFHSHFLPEAMPQYGYRLVKRTKLMGVGATTYQALFSLDFKMRGLRLSIYAQSALAQQILDEEGSLMSDIGTTQKEYICGSVFIRNKGATASYIRIPRVGTLALLNAHLPFNSQSLYDSAVRHDPMIRRTDVQNQNICFNEIYRKLVLDLPVKPDYVIYMGDFNYRNNSGPVGAHRMATTLQDRGDDDFYYQTYIHCDELYHEMHIRNNIYSLQEGVNNGGPRFLPTGKMIKNRPDRCGTEQAVLFKTGIADQRTPSWCDRILYTTLNAESTMTCIKYDRFDVGATMKLSDHCGVVGVYEIQ